MTPLDLDRLETDAAEVIGTLKDLFKEFEKRVGEIVSVQRIASSEARAEGAQVAKDLHELRNAARTMITEQRAVLASLEKEWQLRIDQNAKRAGEAQAQAFGEKITNGLQGKVDELSNKVEWATRSLTWKSSFRWAAGIAIGIALTIGICVIALVPPRDDSGVTHVLALPALIGLTPAQTQEAISKLSLCQAPKTNDWHVCIEVENPPRLGFGEPDKPRVVVSGM